MQFKSTKSRGSLVSFKDAVLRCVPSDGGLYMPATVMDMRQFFLYKGSGTTFGELISAVTPSLFQGELNPFAASHVAECARDIEPEVDVLDERLSIVKMYNSPTGVFKDFGLSFMASIMGELVKNDVPLLVVSATRGNTGASIAEAFAGRRGMTAVILFPEGPLCGLRPETLTSAGGNIHPVQVRGDFEDCKRLVAEILNSGALRGKCNITSANTINIGRILPQAFYYFYIFIKLKNNLMGGLTVSVPSGNFGNLVSGFYAWKFGMPIDGFVAAMNRNDAFGEFFRGGKFTPRPVISTLSQSLDVSNPANYPRLAAFYQESPAAMKDMVYPCTVDEEETRRAISEAWEKHKVFLDPHGAVAYAAAQRCLKAGRGHIAVMATGHPAKYPDLIAECTGQKIPIPESIARLEQTAEPAAEIPPALEALESALAKIL
jgi:threonine synthase